MTLLSPVFLTTGNVGNILSQTAAIALLAIGQLVVIVTKGIDLSVGSTLALASVLGALAFRNGSGAAVVIVVMLATGAAVGFVNGAGYVWGRLPHPFIITLATLSIARGLALRFSDGQPVRGVPSIVQTIGGGSIGWLPYSAFLVAGIAVVISGVMSRLVFGRWVYATGGNTEAARRTGIPVRSVLISVYVLCGLLAGVAAIITSGRLNAGSPTSGSLAELDSIAAVIIGGASFLGGRGNVGNALVGALMIGVIRNGMNLLNVDAFLQPIVIGVVIVLAVESDVLRARLEDRFRVLQAAHDMSPALSVRGATKRFGAVLALDSVDVDVHYGEVLALLGDNGAGKSTLIKCITGVHRLDEGEIEIDGQPAHITSPAAARAHGIETVYQDLALFDNLTPSANFYAGREDAVPHWLPRPLRVLRRRSMADATVDVLDRLQVSLPERSAVVGLMSGGQRQAIAVARAAAFASKVVILDEPTAALGVRESRRVLDLISRLRAEGHAVIVISHALDHVTEVADRAVVMRRGRKVGEEVPSPESQQRIVALIVGTAA